MAAPVHLPGLPIQNIEGLDASRHSVLVRMTHWIFTLSFFGLVLSGIAIILAHPRLYWGEAGAVGMPSLIDLPVPFVRDIPIRGPGRYLHYFSAWTCVLTGLIYVFSGLLTQHFRRNLMPAHADFSWRSISQVAFSHLRLKRPAEEDAQTYNVLQRLSYLAVVFLFLPLMIWTGLAMSPAIVSVFPFLVTSFGGQQSARTLHFFLAVVLVLFLFVHIAMVCLAGFALRTRAMITGHSAARKDRP
ncbi:MAG TPA: cytochrome b/b6 domain-containing protein [Candidatus Eisenbacteria bacterium]|nr:cytochrome b/b6 domain-containing protein [Candidatus Eisenbacteria bacterium]